MEIFLQNTLDFLSKLLTAPLLKIGGTIISLNSIFKLVLAIIIVIVFCRALNRLLRRRLLVKLKIDEGNRAVIATVISYTIGTISLILVLQGIGFNLASLAVIAGGLGVGIGFGLQDLTKNFISGLTILLERTIKVGDFVEFDKLSGYIKEISIRSTLIRTREGGDVVVPNSHLVENRLLNWSYDGFQARIHIPVNVAYGSDTVLVTEALLKSAYMEPSVLHHPSPLVLFRGFGESSLDFELRVWVNRIDKEPDIRSSLNFIIEYNLCQHEITIPFPQRDLWLRNPEVLTATNPQSNNTPTSLPRQSHKPLSLRYLLRQVTYFEHFTDLELRQLIEIGYRQRLRASEVLFREGDPGNAFYIILSGSVEVVVEKLNKHLATLNAGEFFGELSLMLGIPRTATVRALKETLLFAIDNKFLEKLLQSQPELAEAIVQVLGEHREELYERQRQLREMGLVDAAEDDKNPVIWVRKRLKNLFGL